ncbi:2-keto-3-deoxygluconate permease [Desulfosporosinus acidiphilus SJ4]|uniref:2-keto-3-deoxygluconate permease n=1 Tax=Desulfosporosinus acidiphilus (strain DSM 22704 / JCM 16185 / SJ4) TaxID=646529 RepID=I4DAM9_DESAJ|nr:2-keto-3-deoxygluconate permease [Desulfosporosinus acidiphilus]AFM42853.1 2-keto-3-deoxygluconate permease [Desulfosporosinus acidiphilus SJ4]
MQVPILKTMKKVPGGLMVLPLIIGALINTFFPHALTIGGFTQALFKDGASALIGMFLFCMGSQISIKQAGTPIKRGTISVIIKFVIGAAIAITVGKLFGAQGLFGITPMVWMSAFSSVNTGLYVALADQFGTSDDVGAGAMIALTGGAFFTMIALGASGLASIPILSMVAVIVPVIVGFILGNLDADLKKFLGQGQHALIPFFAFALGAGMNFQNIIKAGIPGIILGISVVVITGLAGYFIHSLLGYKAGVSAAIGNTAGNQLATPLAIVAADATLKPFLASATAQIATAVIVTAILCPLLVGYLDKKLKANENLTKLETAPVV